MRRKHGEIKALMMNLMLTIVLVGGISISHYAQFLPDEAVLPAGKGAWVVEQRFKTSIGGSYIPGYIAVVIQSDGVVFHRKLFQDARPATPWCQDKFTDAEMCEIRGAAANAKPSAWQPTYGEFINVLAPFRALILTVRDANGKAVEYKTTVFRFNEASSAVANLFNAIDAAGDLAFSNCQQSEPSETETAEKIESGLPIYAVNGKGDLFWYNHPGFQTGDFVWANNAAPKNVGYEWGGNARVFKGDPHGRDGIIYTVNEKGWLSWFKHRGFQSGSNDWLDGKNVGVGFNGRQIFSGGDGVIYLIDEAGEIYWNKHLGYQTGEKSWAKKGIGIKVGDAANRNWSEAKFVFSGGDGVIYAITDGGDLFWHKHLGFQDGAARWSERKKIGSGWQIFRQIFSGREGIIYAVKPDGTLYWYQHKGFATGAVSWANNAAPKEIGNGWQFRFVF